MGIEEPNLQVLGKLPRERHVYLYYKNIVRIHRDTSYMSTQVMHVSKMICVFVFQGNAHMCSNYSIKFVL